MKFSCILFLLIFSFSLSAQSAFDLKKKFDTYLSFNGSLNSLVTFNATSVSILNAGAPEFTVFYDEIPTLPLLLKKGKPADFLAIYTWKKNKHLSQKQLDSLKGNAAENTIHAYKQPALKGKRIAIDPGHFAGDMQTARIEQKFIDFSPSSLN